MNIELTKEQEEFVSQQLRSGRFSTAAEVVDEAFSGLGFRVATLDVVRSKIARGLAQAERGEFSQQSIPDIIADCNRRFDLIH